MNKPRKLNPFSGSKSAALLPRAVVAALALAVIAQPSVAQDLGIKAPPQSGPITIINVAIYPVASTPLERGYISFDQGIITAIGSMDEFEALDATARGRLKGDGISIIDGSASANTPAMRVYPGLFVPYTQLGLTEIAAVRSTLDIGEVGVTSPEVRAVVAVNPDSALIPVTRSNGVLLAAVFPQTNPGGLINYFEGPGGMIPGRPGVIRLDGWTWEDMTVLDDAGLVVNWPQARPIEAWWMDKSVEDQQKEIDARLSLLDEFFTSARAYIGLRPDAKSPGTLPVDLRFEGMRSVLGTTQAQQNAALRESSQQRTIERADKATQRVGRDAPADRSSPSSSAPSSRPVFVLANDLDQITQAVLFCARHGVRCVIVGGNDAPQCADLLKRHRVGVIVLGTIRFPKRDDAPYDDAFTLPARLEAAGLQWCLSSGEEAAHERNLPYSAALAAAYGLDNAAALRSITLSPAQILGVDDRYGSLEVGKSATLILTTGDPLEIMTHTKAAYIDGRIIDLRNKQTELERKYREKYRQSGATAKDKAAAATPAAPPMPAVR